MNPLRMATLRRVFAIWLLTLALIAKYPLSLQAQTNSATNPAAAQTMPVFLLYHHFFKQINFLGTKAAQEQQAGRQGSGLRNFYQLADETDLFNAARNNRTEVLKSYLAAKGDPNRRDPDGHPLLILAAYNGSPEAVGLLLKYGADANIQDSMGTSLMAASFKGQMAIVKSLLASGARVNERNGIGATALMFASMTARFEIVRLLLKHRADIDAEDERGLTASGLAEQQGSGDMVNVLKNAGKVRRSSH